MSALDILRFAFRALRGNALRTALSMTGVAIGVASVIILTSLGEGARTYVVDQFASLGTNILIVVPGRTETTGGLPGIGGVANDLTIADAEALARDVRTITRVAPVSNGNETVSVGGRSKQVMILGCTAEMRDLRNIEMRTGRYLPEGDWERGTSVAVLGSGIARDLFPGTGAIGKVVRIGDFRMRVIGVMAARGVTLGMDFDQIVMVPLATGMRLFNRSSLFRIMLQHDPQADVERIQANVTRILVDRHDEEDFTLITQDAVMSAFSQIFAALTAGLAGIAAISLSVAGIGIMNVMLVSVSERTHEIGLLKAVGAHPTSDTVHLPDRSGAAEHCWRLGRSGRRRRRAPDPGCRSPGPRCHTSDVGDRRRPDRLDRRGRDLRCAAGAYGNQARPDRRTARLKWRQPLS